MANRRPGSTSRTEKENRLPSEILGEPSEGWKIADRIKKCLISPPNALKPLVLVGAGVSSRVGFPTWGQLMDKLHDVASEERRKFGARSDGPTESISKRLLTKQDYLWRAQYYCNELGADRFEQFVAGVFAQPMIGSGKAIDPCLDAIINLPVSHVLTTNYDTCLDGTHERLREQSRGKMQSCEVINADDPVSIRRFIETLLTPDRRRYYVHLHGRVDQRDSIVLTEASYQKRYLANSAWARTLYSVFSTRQLLCVGFSATDPDLTHVLREISALGAGVPHYAILGIDDAQGAKLERQRLEQKYGISPLLYRLHPDAGKRHENLEVILSWLIGKPPAPTDAIREAARRKSASAPDIPALKPKGKGHSVTNPKYPDDPRKGCFGELPERDGLRLEAKVTTFENDPEWFRIVLNVKGGGSRLARNDQVQFYVHPSFPSSRYVVRAAGMPTPSATLSLVARGAFTVGVTAQAEGKKSRTALELDLAELEDAPATFRSR